MFNTQKDILIVLYVYPLWLLSLNFTTQFLERMAKLFTLKHTDELVFLWGRSLSRGFELLGLDRVSPQQHPSGQLFGVSRRSRGKEIL